ncbi:MAG: anti-sigma factor family protein [Planctomycetota bacterium]
MNICAELRPRIVAFLDGELSDAAAATVASHLEACDACRAERATIVATRELLGELPAPAPAPDAWKRIRREIRPTPRVARAWNAPIPMWAVGSMAAGFLGLAVLFNAGESSRTVPDTDSVTQPGDAEWDKRRVQPTAPGITPSRKPGIDVVPGPGTPSPADPASAGGDPPHQTPPEDDVTPAGPRVPAPGPKTAAPTPSAGTEPAAPTVPAPAAGTEEPATPSAGVEHSEPVDPAGPSTPAVVQWESVALSRVDAPRLPAALAHLAEPVAFSPGGALPIPRGAGFVETHVKDNGDLVVDRVGKERREHFFTISRRRAQQNRDGVSFDLVAQYENGQTAVLQVSVRKAGDQWLFQNRTARRGKWLGKTVVVVDGDHNGRYADPGEDLVVFAERAEVVPVSSVLLTRDGLTEFGVDPLGGRFRVRPYTGATGTLQVDAAYNGSGKATSVVVRSGARYFEVARHAGTPVALPVGTYTVVDGLMVSKHARMRILTGESASVEVTEEAAAPAAIALGGQCAMEYGLDGDPEQGWVSVALTSIAVRGGAGEVYEPLGQGLRMVSFQLRDAEGRLLKQQKAAPTRCPKNGHERFGVKLPNSVARDDVSVQLFAPAYEKTFGSVAGAFPEKRR